MLKCAACPGNAPDLCLSSFRFVFINFFPKSNGNLEAVYRLSMFWWWQLAPHFCLCWRLTTLMDYEKRGTKEQAILAFWIIPALQILRPYSVKSFQPEICSCGSNLLSGQYYDLLICILNRIVIPILQESFEFSYACVLCIFRSAKFSVLHVYGKVWSCDESCTYILFPYSRESGVVFPGSMLGNICYTDLSFVFQVRILTGYCCCNFSSGHNSNCKPGWGSEDFIFFCLRRLQSSCHGSCKKIIQGKEDCFRINVLVESQRLRLMVKTGWE